MNHSWSFEWLTDWNAIWSPDFINQWEKWVNESPTGHVFFLPAIIRAWVETYKPLRRIEPQFLIASHESGRKVFLPLVYEEGNWKTGWHRIIVPPGYGECDYLDPIVIGDGSGEWISDWWEQLCSNLPAVVKKPFDYFVLPRLRSEKWRDTSFSTPQVDAVPVIDFGSHANWSSFIRGGERRKLREDLARFQRFLVREGEISHEIFWRCPASTTNAALEGFCKAHRVAWPTAGTPYRYYHLLAEYGLESGIFGISVLKVGEKPVSWKLFFYFRESLPVYVQAHVERCQPAAAYSPGTFHTAKLLEWAFSQKFRTVELGRGLEKWKSRWTDQAFILHDLRWDTQSFRSRLCRRWQNTFAPVLVAMKHKARACFHLGADR